MVKKEVKNKLKKATFAGGCFWCMQHPFEELDGVRSVVVGYSGGKMKDPSYEDVSSGKTGHVEAIQITYNHKKIDYGKLLDIFWRQIDLTDSSGQFADRGEQYKTAIFYHDAEQKKIAEKSKKELEKSGRFNSPIATKILQFKNFYDAETYHQDYYKKNPLAYKMYKIGSGRDKFLKDAWSKPIVCSVPPPKSINKDDNSNKSFKKPDAEEIKKNLSPMQYQVTQECGTEPAFNNKYWNNKKEGIYIDIVSGEPLFSSHDKYDSGTGWPSFTKPLEAKNVVEKKDRSFFMSINPLDFGSSQKPKNKKKVFLMKRIEVKSKNADSHLGHVFDDGSDDNGLRYCINSSALRFIAEEDLEKEGYGKYKKLFK